MSKKLIGSLIGGGSALLPLLVFAQDFDSFENVIQTITRWINQIIPLLIGVAVLVFLWGIVKYVTAGSDGDKRKEGLGLMGYGILAIFVMISVWGLVGVLVNTFDLDNEPPTELPRVPGTR